ncbi:type VI secretion system membrane subunit TssM [Methylobacterium brachythecii]|uniref:Type VI secretion protein n=1 Tax=Methylobacterium brachythecii TaxID=1176177 RepID=A0A7W6AJL8_9HYPH|nr:type VI secretion system membrane subunit TssM [Methylobacterium brachythecii]MBB3902369.1 type VI secretion system protein ImpL [Methylobacterium brachythecii]GLS42217.1 type VI secretion protein [Methylobacterium brachythecii]
MTLRAWLRLAALLLGALALSALFWWAGPLVAIADVRPLEPIWVRVLICVLIWLGVAGTIGWEIYRRRKATRALQAELAGDQADATGDADVLKERMADALATLKKSHGGKGSPLYDLPWYVIIGPPGAGKTTALVRSGLKFPLAKGRTPEAVAGLGGTRYCDWWFTEEAVLIDTAGRYTTQDSDPKGDRASWLSFLDLLHRTRPKQPINGVLIAISLEDVLTGNETEIEQHATAIRKRLVELHDRLKVDFPVYAVFTKADLVSGFTEFFGQLSETDRQMVWGHTFQTAEKTRNMIGEVPAEFDALVERLNEWMPDRLQDEVAPTSRVVLFGFPSQVAAARARIVDFLGRVFEPSRFHVNATLRGFYFTSGTQEGTPIDQIIGALSRSFGSQDIAAASYSGRGKSYFLTDLMRKVVIGEAGWVSTNRAAMRRTNLVRLGAYGALALASAVLVGLWWTSYLHNGQLVALTNSLTNKYRADAAETLREPVIADRNFSKVLPLLNSLRYLPAGYAGRDEGEPILATFGLSQRPRLRSAAETSYRAGLERLFRPRLIFRLEEQLEANRNNPGFVYEALKVYLMLGARAEGPLDRGLVVSWFRRDWTENLYPGAGFARGRQLLEDHLQAMLELDDGSAPLVSLNQALIEDSQRTLARLSIAERTYELLKSDARGALSRDWTVQRAAGADAGLVFEAVGGGDLETVRVPFFFTYDGFFEAFIDRFGEAADIAERDRWVLGSAGEQQAYKAQYGSLFTDLLRVYSREFQQTWAQNLKKLKIRSLTADKPRYLALQAIAAPTSPLKLVIESIIDETRLTRERPTRPDASRGSADPRAGKAKAVLGAAAGKEAEKALSSVLPSNIADTATSLGRVAMEGRPGGGAGAPDRFALPANQAPGASIEATFRPFHVLMEGDAGRRATDALVNNLNEIKNAALEATNPNQSAPANNALVTQTAALRSLASRFPQPFEAMIRQVANEFEGNAAGAAVSQLGKALADEVLRDCQQIAVNRYPFARNSDREVPLADFAKLFAPNGVFDKFFTQHLASHADRSRPQWTWRVDDQVARGLSAATLREFQRAAEIRDTFFSTGGNMPAVAFSVTPMSLNGDAGKATLDMNGTAVVAQGGVNTPVTVQWPGPATPARTALQIEGTPSFFGTSSGGSVLLEKTGTWSLFRLLDGGSILKQGDAVVATITAGSRQLSLRFTTSTVQNPLVLPALREFRCPTGI